MHVLLVLLAVLGSALAAPQSFAQPQPFAFSAPTNTLGFARQDPFPSTAGRRVINLDSGVFAPTGDVAFHQGTFGQSPRQTAHVVSRTEYLNDNGEFSSSFQGSDGTQFSETGSLQPTNDGKDNVVVKSGSFGYTSPEGIPVSVTYTADQYGFHPVSSSIPQSVQPIAPTF